MQSWEKTLKGFKIPNQRMDNEGTVMRFIKTMIKEHGDWDSDDFVYARNQEFGFPVFTAPIEKRFTAVPCCAVTATKGRAIDDLSFSYEPICSIAKYKEYMNWTVADNENPEYDFGCRHDSYIDAAYKAEWLNQMGRHEKMEPFIEELNGFRDKVRAISEEFIEPYPSF